MMAITKNNQEPPSLEPPCKRLATSYPTDVGREKKTQTNKPQTKQFQQTSLGITWETLREGDICRLIAAWDTDDRNDVAGMRGCLTYHGEMEKQVYEKLPAKYVGYLGEAPSTTLTCSMIVG